MRRTLSVALALATCAPALAQVGVPRGGPKGGSIFHITLGAAPASLVAERSDVQREIKLQPAQKAKIDQIVKAHARDSLRPGPRMWSFVSATLTPAQRKRVCQLSVQALGPFCAYAPEFQKDLGITAAQTKRLDAVKRVYLLGEDRGLAESMMGKSKPAADARAVRKQRMQTLTSGVSSVLTRAQKTKLKAMGGKSFAFNPPIKDHGLVVWMPAFGMH